MSPAELGVWRRMMNWRSELETIVRVVPPDQVPDAIGELARSSAVLYTRMMRQPVSNPNGRGGKAAEPDRLLDVNEAAAILGVKVSWMYRHADEFGATRLSRKCLRFSEARIRREAERRRRLETPR